MTTAKPVAHRLVKAVQHPLHREHLRTASLIVMLEVLAETSAVSRGALTTTMAIMVFLWDFVFILIAAEQDGDL